MKRLIFILLLGVVLFKTLNSCDGGKIDSQKDKCETGIFDSKLIRGICDEYSTPLNIINQKDMLKIVVQRSDCGEWGGNKEYIYLQRNDSDKICARFILDTISCDKIIEKNGYGVLDDSLRKIVVDTSKVLSINEEVLISKMLQRILELYLKNEVHSNAGSYFEISNSDGTMNICYWNSGDCQDTYYYKTRRQIFGDYKLK